MPDVQVYHGEFGWKSHGDAINGVTFREKSYDQWIPVFFNLTRTLLVSITMYPSPKKGAVRSELRRQDTNTMNCTYRMGTAARMNCG
jgi:hypothetical protein